MVDNVFGVFGAPQKALHLHLEEAKKAPKHIGQDYVVMEKFDGWFMYIDCISGVWQGVRSKTGRLLPSMAKYSQAFAEGPKPNQDIRLIFEAVIPGMIFKDANGKFNAKAELPLGAVILKAHDILFARYPYTAFEKRYDRLESVVSYLKHHWLELVEILYIGNNTEIWKRHFEEIVARRGEGVILKQLYHAYEPGKRNANLMKIKCELTLDLLVIGVAPGLKGTKYENTLGALVVQEKSGQEHQVSGMSDQQRAEWWSDPSSIIGRIVEIDAMLRLPNGSLREPRFKAVRYDKTMEDRD